MRLKYREGGQSVRAGDMVQIGDGVGTVVSFGRPHKPSSEGKVTVDVDGDQREYYVSVIGAEWTDREDR